MLTNKFKKESGFTLIEIAVVLVLVGLILGSFIGSLTSRIETTRRDNTANQLEEIKSIILGFASARGRLPCPAMASSTGNEQPVSGSNAGTPCTLQHGFIPGKTLGISGSYNLDNLLVDSWGNPIRYSVTTTLSNAFTNSPGISSISGIGIANLTPDLTICTAFSTAPAGCTSTAQTLVNNAPFVILSLGKDGGNFVESITASGDPPTTDQGENAGEAKVAANALGENVEYTVGLGTEFVSTAYSSVGSTAGQFDDLILWVSPFELYSRMIEAGQIIIP